VHGYGAIRCFCDLADETWHAVEILAPAQALYAWVMLGSNEPVTMCLWKMNLTSTLQQVKSEAQVTQLDGSWGTAGHGHQPWWN
jgi:hypothetical protein